MKPSIKIGFVLLFLEFVWIIQWFAYMVIYNTHKVPAVPPDMESSHFTAVIRVVGLVAVIAALFEMYKESPDPINLLLQTLALLGVVLLDIRGVLHTFDHFWNYRFSDYWNYFAASALMAIIFTSLEFAWLLANSIWHFKDALKKMNYTQMNDPLLIPTTKRNHTGLKDF
jgi:hypothetical protein